MFSPNPSTALLLIDVQQGFDDPTWGPRNNPKAEANIAALLAAWRLHGASVFHIFHDSKEDGSPLHPTSRGNAPRAEAEPLPGEMQFRKNVNSAFIGTDLEFHLHKGGFDKLVVVGLTTNHCVSTTVRMAANLGFDTAVVSDATAAFDGATVDGRKRPAREVHDGALSDLHGEFASVIKTYDLIDGACSGSM